MAKKIYYPTTRVKGRKNCRRCWNCGRFRAQVGVCTYCNEHFDDEFLHRFHGDAGAAVAADLRKSEMIDHSKQDVPSPG